MSQSPVVADHHMRVDLVSTRPKRVKFDALMVAGGQSPMFTFREHPELQRTIRHFYEAKKPTAAYCHVTGALVDLKLSDGSYLVGGKTVTGQQQYSGRRVAQMVIEALGV